MCFTHNNIKNLTIICFLLAVGFPNAQEENSFLTGRLENCISTRSVTHPQYILDQLNKYDVNFYMLDLNVSNTTSYISGNTTVISTLVSPLDTFYLELIDSLSTTTFMVVDSVFINGVKRQFTHSNSLLKIPFPSELPGLKITTVVYYHGNGGPEAVTNYSFAGVYFTTTWSEPENAKVWFPCKQVLTDKADSSWMIITTRSTNKAGSNGLLVSTTILPDDKIRYVWKSKYPVAYYLISFAVGPYLEYDAYAKIDGLADSVLIQNYLIDSSPLVNQHKIAVEKIKLCMNLFSRLFGAYPFKEEKYGHSVYGGALGAMENQTMTTIGYDMFDTTAHLYAGLAYYFGAPHELAHSWFGDYVTCASWNDLWINEGFASYCEYIALQLIDSKNNADKWINEARTTAMKSPGGSVYTNGFLSGWEPYRLLYKKGALILHMLRYELSNDSLFFYVLKSFVARYANRTATGLDFKSILEEKTARDFSQFFNQWYFGEGYPIFKIDCKQNNDTLLITSTQTKSVSSALLFKTPFMLQLQYSGGDTTLNLYQSQDIENFIIPFSKKITKVVFDPDNWLLAKSTVILTDADENQQTGEITFDLSQNYPNPFNSGTVINYQIPANSYVTIKVFDILGNEVVTLVNEETSPGNYKCEFNGAKLPSGLYFYRLQAGTLTQTKKMILLR